MVLPCFNQKKMTTQHLEECKEELAELEKTLHQYTGRIALSIITGRIDNLKKLIKKHS